MATLSLKKKTVISDTAESTPINPVTATTAPAATNSKPVKKYHGDTVLLDSIKISVVLPADSIPYEICPPVGLSHSSKMKVIWKLAVPEEAGKTLWLTVPFSPTNYRRTLNKIDALKAEGKACIVLLQGKLQGDGVVKEAGLTVHESKSA
ncbi:hypothetical protein BegalDRAFT_0131 [Beggiatoa alba B18LD]|uniref:Uncharacterized protein n=1 Tax=Beggiatoa alba B18LD TaxID=395493 RepID=I3CBR2_9GAMM|nr:hypothetical protein [Beggiatoa alba]EIJ41055.1 hypothetical protein BegalDRAFT_0131 [Beggiatoa alba B18LD]